MQITRAADYAVRVMVHLSSVRPGVRVQRSVLVEVSEAPESFLSKVLQRLVGSGLITSRRGGGGGFQLAVSPREISVLAVVEAIDGPIRLNLCVPGASGCERSLACAVHPVWMKAQDALTKILRKTTMIHLAREAQWRQEGAQPGMQPERGRHTVAPRQKLHENPR